MTEKQSILWDVSAVYEDIRQDVEHGHDILDYADLKTLERIAGFIEENVPDKSE